MAQTQMIDLFKKKEPKVDVVVQIVPYGTFDQQLLQATAAGRGPDVARVWIQNLGMHVESKGLQPLDEFFKHWTKEQKEDFIFRSSWQDAVFDGLKMAFYVEHRVRVLWYRADLLGAKNVKPRHARWRS